MENKSDGQNPQNLETQPKAKTEKPKEPTKPTPSSTGALSPKREEQVRRFSDEYDDEEFHILESTVTQTTHTTVPTLNLHELNQQEKKSPPGPPLTTPPASPTSSTSSSTANSSTARPTTTTTTSQTTTTTSTAQPSHTQSTSSTGTTDSNQNLERDEMLQNIETIAALTEPRSTAEIVIPSAETKKETNTNTSNSPLSSTTPTPTTSRTSTPTATSVLEARAEEGNAGAMFSLAEYFEGGKKFDGPQKDMNQAISWYEKAAAAAAAAQIKVVNGNKGPVLEVYESLYRLGDIFENGTGGVGTDIGKAINYYEQSAQAGAPYSSFRLAEIYEQGKHDVEKDMDKAIQYYQAVVDAGPKSPGSSSGCKAAREKLEALTFAQPHPEQKQSTESSTTATVASNETSEKTSQKDDDEEDDYTDEILFGSGSDYDEDDEDEEKNIIENFSEEEVAEENANNQLAINFIKNAGGEGGINQPLLNIKNRVDLENIKNILEALENSEDKGDENHLEKLFSLIQKLNDSNNYTPTFNRNNFDTPGKIVALHNMVVKAVYNGLSAIEAQEWVAEAFKEKDIAKLLENTEKLKQVSEIVYESADQTVGERIAGDGFVARICAAFEINTPEGFNEKTVSAPNSRYWYYCEAILNNIEPKLEKAEAIFSEEQSKLDDENALVTPRIKQTEELKTTKSTGTNKGFAQAISGFFGPKKNTNTPSSAMPPPKSTPKKEWPTNPQSTSKSTTSAPSIRRIAGSVRNATSEFLKKHEKNPGGQEDSSFTPRTTSSQSLEYEKKSARLETESTFSDSEENLARRFADLKEEPYVKSEATLRNESIRESENKAFSKLDEKQKTELETLKNKLEQQVVTAAALETEAVIGPQKIAIANNGTHEAIKKLLNENQVLNNKSSQKKIYSWIKNGFSLLSAEKPESVSENTSQEKLLDYAQALKEIASAELAAVEIDKRLLDTEAKKKEGTAELTTQQHAIKKKTAGQISEITGKSNTKEDTKKEAKAKAKEEKRIEKETFKVEAEKRKELDDKIRKSAQETAKQESDQLKIAQTINKEAAEKLKEAGKNLKQEQKKADPTKPANQQKSGVPVFNAGVRKAQSPGNSPEIKEEKNTTILTSSSSSPIPSTSAIFTSSSTATSTTPNTVEKKTTKTLSENDKDNIELPLFGEKWDEFENDIIQAKIRAAETTPAVSPVTPVTPVVPAPSTPVVPKPVVTPGTQATPTNPTGQITFESIFTDRLNNVNQQLGSSSLSFSSEGFPETPRTGSVPTPLTPLAQMQQNLQRQNTQKNVVMNDGINITDEKWAEIKKNAPAIAKGENINLDENVQEDIIHFLNPKEGYNTQHEVMRLQRKESEEEAGKKILEISSQPGKASESQLAELFSQTNDPGTPCKIKTIANNNAQIGFSLFKELTARKHPVIYSEDVLAILEKAALKNEEHKKMLQDYKDQLPAAIEAEQQQGTTLESQKFKS